MNLQQLGSVFMIIVLTVVAGLADALGAVWASRIWNGNTINTDAILRASLGFAAGISLYFIVVRFFNNVGVVTAEVQTAIYFSVMLVGVALINREFFRWQLIDQVVAVLIIVGIGWLSVRVGS